MNLSDKINKVILNEPTKRSWKNNFLSKEWILANEVSIVIMREPLNRSVNCGCLTDLYIMLKSINESKIKLKILQMENKFELKKGILLFYKGTHYSNANITDEVSIDILTNFPIKSKDFSKLPKDWEKICEIKDVSPKVPGNDKDEELESLSDEVLRDLCNKLALSNKELKKVHHKAGRAKMIKFLTDNKVNG